MNKKAIESIYAALRLISKVLYHAQNKNRIDDTRSRILIAIDNLYDALREIDGIPTQVESNESEPTGE